MKIYLASPLFTKMEVDFNFSLAKEIRKINSVKLFLPQEQDKINDKNNYADSKTIAIYDTEELLNSDLMIAVLDGISIDAGVAAEIGVAYQAKIPIIGLYTDARQKGFKNQEKINALSEIGESQFFYLNLYPVGLIKLNGNVVNNISDLCDEIRLRIGEIDIW